MDAVLAWNTDGEISVESERPTHVFFIDLEKTYDRVPGDMLWEGLEKEEVCIA
jgi:acetolactate synthase regulatory subunit